MVNFKNVPDAYTVNPLEFSVSPSRAQFNIFVDEYDKTTSSLVGTIDFKTLSPSNNSFTFSTEGTNVVDGSVDEFEVTVDMEGFSEEYMTITSDEIKVNNPGNKTYKISDVSKSVVVVGKENDLKSITHKQMKVEIDLSQVEWKAGETITIPAIVSVDSSSCWIYGNYTVEITMM